MSQCAVAQNVKRTSGSLVIAIETNKGLLVMSDRLCRSEGGRDEFELDKILKIDKHTLVSTTGCLMIRLETPDRIGQTCFNANETTKALLSKQDLSGSVVKFLPELSQKLSAQYSTQMITPNLKYSEILRTVLFHYNQQDDKYEIPSVTLAEVGEIVTQPQISIHSDAVHFGIAVPYGANKYLEQIGSGEIDVQNSSMLLQIKKRLSASEPATTLSLEQAIDTLFAMFFLVTDFEERCGTHSIGPLVDAYLLSPSGVRRLMYRRKFKLPSHFLQKAISTAKRRKP